jgi:hypothetical protein
LIVGFYDAATGERIGTSTYSDYFAIRNGIAVK